jgi:hypothetical protein
MEFVPDGRYLLRLRESIEGGTWRGDLVRENGEAYISFAKSRDMQLAIMDKKGRGALQRNIDKLPPDVWAEDSTARLAAIGQGEAADRHQGGVVPADHERRRASGRVGQPSRDAHPGREVAAVRPR